MAQPSIAVTQLKEGLETNANPELQSVQVPAPSSALQPAIKALQVSGLPGVLECPPAHVVQVLTSA